MGSKVDTSNGNQAKALILYHLMHQDDVTGNVRKESKNLKKLMYTLFELSQGRLKTDADGEQRFYFRESGSDEGKHAILIDWLFDEFKRQVFGRRQGISCV